MKLLPYHALFLALTALHHTSAFPLSERTSPYKHPIAHIVLPIAAREAPGLTPTTHLLDRPTLQHTTSPLPGLSISQPSPSPSKRTVFGTESRYLQTKSGNPWDYIGRLEWALGKDAYRCSAALVGPRHLATARHCFNQSSNAISYTFRPNYDQGARGYTAAQITDVYLLPGSLSDTCSYGDDFAVMVLNQRLGDKYGYFGVKQLGGAKGGFYHEGYPYDLGKAERPYLQDSIAASTSSQCSSGTAGPILTQADSAEGQSGGPLWLLPEADGVRYTYGVLSATSSSNTLFAGRTAFLNAVAQARSDYP